MKKILIITTLLLCSCTMTAGPVRITITQEQAFRLYKIAAGSRAAEKETAVITAEGYVISVK